MRRRILQGCEGPQRETFPSSKAISSCGCTTASGISRTMHLAAAFGVRHRLAPQEALVDALRGPARQQFLHTCSVVDAGVPQCAVGGPGKE